MPLRMLLWVMFALGVLGVAAFVGHGWQQLPAPKLLVWSLIYGLQLLSPLLLLGLPTALLHRRYPWATTGAGLLSALAGAWYCYILGDPKYNQDANIGLGMYLLFGALWPLGPVWLFGGVVGQVVSWVAEWREGMVKRSNRLKV